VCPGGPVMNVEEAKEDASSNSLRVGSGAARGDAKVDVSFIETDD